MTSPSDKLAIDGGRPVNQEPFPVWPQFDPKVLEVVQEPLRTGRVNYWTGGIGMQFEQAFADWCGARFGISTTNGTSALHTALAGLGIGSGDEVIVPSYTFIATSFSRFARRGRCRCSRTSRRRAIRSIPSPWKRSSPRIRRRFCRCICMV